MRWYANELGYGEDADFWATVGLLHDIDFEMWPEQHCLKAPELLKKAGCSEGVHPRRLFPRLWAGVRRGSHARDGEGAVRR